VTKLDIQRIITQHYTTYREGFSIDTKLLILLWCAWEGHSDKGLAARMQLVGISPQTSRDNRVRLSKEAMLHSTPAPFGKAHKVWHASESGLEKIRRILNH
jgi:hypothetical protein